MWIKKSKNLKLYSRFYSCVQTAMITRNGKYRKVCWPTCFVIQTSQVCQRTIVCTWHLRDCSLERHLITWPHISVLGRTHFGTDISRHYCSIQPTWQRWSPLTFWAYVVILWNLACCRPTAWTKINSCYKNGQLWKGKGSISSDVRCRKES